MASSGTNSKLKKTFLPIIAYVPIDIKRLFREKVAIFFVFLFPLMFLFVFGSIFSGDKNVSFRVALLNESNSQFSQKFSEQIMNSAL